MVTTEPEWTEEHSALAVALTLLDEHTHPDCGGYLPDTMRRDIARDVQETTRARCEDCAAIEAHMKERHKAHLDSKGKTIEGICDCDEVMAYIADRVPLADIDDDPEGGAAGE